MKWLRRRIIASIATQSAETFAVVAVIAFALMQWRTSEGPLSSLFGAVVIAQIFVVARLGHAMRNNPLNYVFMREYVERPFSYKVARFQGDEEAHAVALGLPGFAPVATIRDADADPEPVFDVYHDPSRLVAASVSRASGSVALISSLADGRILVTDARAMPPHERLVMSLADDDSLETVIATHQRAIAERNDVVELASSAHQVVLESLTIEYDSYLALGPALSPFLDLEPGSRSPMRLIARIKKDELITLPVRLGPDKPLPSVRITPPVPAAPLAPVAPVAAPIVQAPVVQAAAVEAPVMAAPVMAAAAVEAPVMAAPVMAAAAVEAPVIAAPVMQPADVVAPATAAPAMETAPVEAVAPTPVQAAPAAPVMAPVAAATPIAPPQFATVEPEADDFVDTSEPITAEVPAIEFAQAPVPEQIPIESLVAHHLSVLQANDLVAELVDSTLPSQPTAPAAAAPVAPAPAQAPAAPVAPVAAPAPVAPVAAPAPVAPVAAPAAPAAPVAPVAAPAPLAPAAPVAPAPAPAAPLAPAAEFAPLPEFATSPPAPPATLAEAVVAAPDTPAQLLAEPVAAAPIPAAAPAHEMAASAVPAAAAQIPAQQFAAPAAAPHIPAQQFAEPEPALVHAAAGGVEPAQPVVGFANVTPTARPKLSAVLRSSSQPTAPDSAPAAKRSRRKSR